MIHQARLDYDRLWRHASQMESDLSSELRAARGERSPVRTKEREALLSARHEDAKIIVTPQQQLHEKHAENNVESEAFTFHLWANFELHELFGKRAY